MTSLARMFPPGDAAHGTVKVNGRSYTCATNGFLDVPVFDAEVLGANGWTRAGGPTCTVGPTASRPAIGAGGQPISRGHTHIDTTLGYSVTWDAKAMTWRSTLTGQPV